MSDVRQRVALERLLAAREELALLPSHVALEQIGEGREREARVGGPALASDPEQPDELLVLRGEPPCVGRGQVRPEEVLLRPGVGEERRLLEALRQC